MAVKYIKYSGYLMSCPFSKVCPLTTEDHRKLRNCPAPAAAFEVESVD